MKKERTQTSTVIFLNEDLHFSRNSISWNQFPLLIPFNPFIFRIFSLLLIRDILARMNQEELLGRTGRMRHDATFLIFCASHSTTLLLYYTNMHVHRHARAHAKGTKLDLQTKLDPRRLSPFFPGTRRVAGTDAGSVKYTSLTCTNRTDKEYPCYDREEKEGYSRRSPS